VDVTPNTIAQSFRDVRPCLNAEAPRVVKKKPTTIDYGSFGVTLRFDATKYDAIKTALEGQGTKPIAVILGDTTKALVATCYVENLGIPQLAEDGEVTMTVSFLIDDDFDSVAASTVVGGGG
jgi:hypothetical protein